MTRRGSNCQTAYCYFVSYFQGLEKSSLEESLVDKRSSLDPDLVAFRSEPSSHSASFRTNLAAI
jgi:hypothetical protein